MSNKLKFYFHIGQPKTGTSAIQAFLNYNRERLAKEFGILYPNFHHKDLGSGFYHNHETLFSPFQLIGDYQEVINYFVECQQYCLEHNIHTVIISWEEFQYDWWPGVISQIEKTLSTEVTFILYLRRQDLLYESGWKQWGHKYPEYHSIHEYILTKEKDHLKYLKNWFVYFTPEQFIVRTFEKSCIGNDVVIDFLSIIGIKDKAGFVEPPKNNLNKNAGLSAEVVEILRLCNYMASNVNDNKILEMVYNALSERFKKNDPFKTYGFLTLDERKKIMEKYEASNCEVAKIFFGNDRTSLFLDPINENDAQPVFQGLTIENTVPVFMELVLSQHETINKLRWDIDNLINKFNNETLSGFGSYSFIEIELKQFYLGIVGEHQISGKKLKKEGLVFTATGNDPNLILANPHPDHEIKALTITLSAPEKTIFQAFFCGSGEQAFTEENSVRRPILKGKNRILLRLPKPQKVSYFRIDSGTLPGKYIIHEIEFGY